MFLISRENARGGGELLADISRVNILSRTRLFIISLVSSGETRPSRFTSRLIIKNSQLSFFSLLFTSVSRGTLVQQDTARDLRPRF